MIILLKLTLASFSKTCWPADAPPGPPTHGLQRWAIQPWMQIQHPDWRGGEAIEAIGRDEAGGGRKRLQKQQLQKENKQEKSVGKGKERRRTSEAPKVLQLIKMLCIYLWALMSSISIVCFFTNEYFLFIILHRQKMLFFPPQIITSWLFWFGRYQRRFFFGGKQASLQEL